MADLKISQLTGATTPLAGTEVLPIVQSGTTKKVAVSDLTAGRAVSAATMATSGNAAVATALVAWNSGYSAFDVGGVVGLTSSVNTDLWYNAYVDAGGTVVYKNGGYPASRVRLDGALKWATTGTTTGTAGGTATLVDTFEIDTNGNVKALTGNLVIGTAGKGIDFSADGQAAGMTSELLDDYEEGTWMATLKGSVTDPTTPVTATGRYTRVGRLVTITVSFDGVDNTGAAGDVTVTGIPFNNSTPFTRVSGTVGYVGNFPIVNKYVACGMDENATAVYFNDIAGIGFGAALQHSPGGGRYLRFEMTYYAA